MQYLKLFETTSDYQTYINGNEGVVLPNVSVAEDAPTTVHYNPLHDFVDLGLPSGTKWATKNVGANAVTDFGLFFAWGETKGYSISYDSENEKWTIVGDKRFDWDEGENDYKFTEPNGYDGDDENYGISKYNNTDGKVKLEPADDAATAAMGGLWHMPSQSQYQELSNECYWEWTNSYNDSNVKGWIVYKVKDDADKGKKKTNSGGDTPAVTYLLSDAHIFFPAAGGCGGGNVWGVGDYGYYWSRSLYTGGVYFAWDLGFYNGSVGPGNYDSRYQGYSVRGVFGELSPETSNQ